MTTEARCPECGGTLTIDQTAQVETPWFVPGVAAMPRIETRPRPALVAFCDGCEWSYEVRIRSDR